MLLLFAPMEMGGIKLINIKNLVRYIQYIPPEVMVVVLAL